MNIDKIIFKEYTPDLWDSFDKLSRVHGLIKNYLQVISNEQSISFILEKNYIDKDYLIDYTNYYARCFDDIGRKVERYHFFKTDMASLKTRISEYYQKKEKDKRDEILLTINELYIGFVIKKPTYNGIIGRTILKRFPPQTSVPNEKRILSVVKENRINIYGIPLKIISLPFQEQDNAVSACATISIWTALRALEDKFGVSVSLAPSEITNKAYNLTSIILSPRFPNDGLSIHQIINTFYNLNYEVITYKVSDYSKPNDFVCHLLMAYLEYGLPIIGILELKKDNHLYGHAVVISGYRLSEGKNQIVQLYVHDDQIGPYSKVTFKNGNVLDWENEWTTKNGYKFVKLKTLIIPIYHKIRLSYTYLYERYVKPLEEKNTENYKIKTFLSDVNSYKSQVIQEILPIVANRDDGEEIVLTQLPKYFWIIRVEVNNIPFKDYLIDATKEIKKTPIIIKYL
jgi:hypothetical protein